MDWVRQVPYVVRVLHPAQPPIDRRGFHVEPQLIDSPHSSFLSDSTAYVTVLLLLPMVEAEMPWSLQTYLGPVNQLPHRLRSTESDYEQHALLNHVPEVVS